MSMSDQTDSNGDSTRSEFAVDDTPYYGNDMETVDDTDRTHVTMEVTMEIGDLDDVSKRVICELARQYEDSFREIVSKNRDYSWSFLTTGSKLSQSEGTPFESPVRSQAYGLLTRSGDKRERLIENVYGDGSQEVSDDPATTAKESANYYQFLALILGNPRLAREAADA